MGRVNPRRHRALALLIAGALGAGALAQAGCGASGDDAVAQAADATSKQNTFRLHQTTSASILGRAVTFRSDGEIDVRRRLSHATLDLSSLRGLAPAEVDKLGGEAALKGDLVVDRGVLDLRLGVLRNGLKRVLHRDPGEWAQVDVAALGKKLGFDLTSLVSSATTSREQAVGYLRALTSSLKKLGGETIDGTPTTHYRGTLDFAHLPANSIPPQTRKLFTQIAQLLKRTGASTKLPVDVWVDRDHLVRREAFTQSISGAQTTTAIAFTDYGKAIDVAVPAKTYDLVKLIDQVAPGTLSGLGGLGGSAAR
ncbi:MAG: hypothetical protein M3Z33_13720 [Actinomycetota bacterium]|nr:hypothetical protein [Actinomycetota bacterium]